ncbi:MAG: D-alanyl-D-alanine carboxypeptidase/D-alanyl-D-alanine-endopeptidase [Candidatus Nanopelagicales bacterium]|nr:D-alanyl-D-alanine carboxypeptidase/D-alanyl-D-alanine-endopeptidase [Candidatus Nanopelagicales bacterium]
MYSSRRSRSWLGGAGAGLVLVAATSFGVSAATGEMPAGPVEVPIEAPGGTPADVPVPVEVSYQSGASKTAVAAAVKEPLRASALGPSARYIVFDPATGLDLASRGATTPVTPASTTKILTAVAALRAFGPDGRIATTVTQPEPGSLVLVGRGDPLLRVDGAAGDGATLGDLAARTVAELRAQHPAGTPEVRLSYDDSLFVGPTRSPTWEGSYTSASTALVPPITALMANRGFIGGDVDPVPAVESARAFAAKLRTAGIKVKSKITRVSGIDSAAPAVPGEVEPAPIRAAPVAQVFSPPMDEIVGQMLRTSDNVTAEMLGHLAGGALGHTYSFAGGAAATRQVLETFGVPTAGLVLEDASGLSRANLIPPETLARTLSVALTEERVQLWPLMSGLPVAGFDGTLADRFSTTSTRGGRGYVRAKTGTLTGVSALAGTVVTRDGITLAFAFLAGQVRDTTAAAAAWDRVAAALAGCDCSLTSTGGS